MEAQEKRYQENNNHHFIVKLPSCTVAPTLLDSELTARFWKINAFYCFSCVTEQWGAWPSIGC